MIRRMELNRGNAGRNPAGDKKKKILGRRFTIHWEKETSTMEWFKVFPCMYKTLPKLNSTPKSKSKYEADWQISF